MRVRIRFNSGSNVPTNRDATEMLFGYEFVHESFLGKPEEKSKTKHYSIRVSVSGRLEASWHAYGLAWKDLNKILFEYGKRYVIDKIKDGTIQENEVLDLLSLNVPSPCEFDPNKIQEPTGYTEIVDIPEVKLLDTTTTELSDKDVYNTDKREQITALAQRIIEHRDYINAIFKLANNEPILYLYQERFLMDLFRDANNLDEFISRISSLSALVTSINSKKLSNVLEITDENKSINMLEEFLKRNNIPIDGIIDVFRNIVSLRKQYPIHGDNLSDVFKSLKFFGLQYPIQDYSDAYLFIKSRYADALKVFYDSIYSLYEKRQ